MFSGGCRRWCTWYHLGCNLLVGRRQWRRQCIACLRRVWRIVLTRVNGAALIETFWTWHCPRHNPLVGRRQWQHQHVACLRHVWHVVLTRVNGAALIEALWVRNVIQIESRHIFVQLLKWVINCTDKFHKTYMNHDCRIKCKLGRPLGKESCPSHGRVQTWGIVLVIVLGIIGNLPHFISLNNQILTLTPCTNYLLYNAWLPVYGQKETSQIQAPTELWGVRQIQK